MAGMIYGGVTKPNELKQNAGKRSVKNVFAALKSIHDLFSTVPENKNGECAITRSVM